MVAFSVAGILLHGRMPVLRFVVSLVVTIAAAACRESPRARPTAAALRDDFGTEIRIAVPPPRRIVSLNPATTEILFAIGAGPRLVGRSQYDDFLKAARPVPDLGPALRPNVEAILGTHPDLVILYGSAENAPSAERLRQAGVPVVGLRFDRIEEFERDARLLGRLTGDSARAAMLVDTIASTLARVRAATSGLPRPTVFMHAWERPLIAIGGGSFLTQLLDIAGARNIYEDVHEPSAVVTIEDVIHRNPDFVLVSPAAAPTLRSSERWQALPAVRAGRVLVYDTLLVGRPGVTLGAAAVSLARLLHPGSVP
jgi:iron complex transport system substrate-binding protein